MYGITGKTIRFVLMALLSFVLNGMGGQGLAMELAPREGPVDIEADSLSYDRDTDTYHAQGNVVIIYSGGRLTAQSVLLDHRTDTAHAEGNVRLTSGRDVLEGDRMTFHLTDKTGVVHAGKVFVAQNHFYLRGDKIAKTAEATYRVEGAEATTCDGPRPDWRLTSREINVTVDGYGTMKHGKLLIRNIPVLYAPYFIFPAKTTRQSGFLLPYLAHSDDHGWDAEVPFYWAISRSLDATFYSRYMDKRGFKEGTEFRYFAGERSSGVLYGDLLNDRKRVTETSGPVSRDWRSDRLRWSLFLNHETVFTEGFYLRADIARVSDAWYFKDFDDRNYYRDHRDRGGRERFEKVSFDGDASLRSLDSTVRLVKDWSRYNLTALARYTDDFTVPSNDVTLQRYPEIILNRATLPLFGQPVYYGLKATYDYLYRGEGQRGHLYDVAPVFTLPIKLGRYAQFTPEVGVRATLWDRDDDGVARGDRHGDREVFHAGFSLNTELSRVFDRPGKSLERLQHTIKPEIAYAYADATLERQVALPDYVARVNAQNLVSYGITNVLTAKVRGNDDQIAYRELLRLKLAQQFDIREARRDRDGPGDPGRRPFGVLALDLVMAPIPEISLVVRNLYDVHEHAWTRTNYDLNARVGRVNLGLGYHNTRDILEEINLAVKADLTRTIRLDYTLRNNLRDNVKVENYVQVTYHRQCWSIGLGYEKKEDDQRVTLLLSLYGLGQAGVH
ncbi:MAG: LPS assembly protein LptD [Syntrophales bacterium]|jgi:LPS-assembly protein|nr:LPS assembly protein LptD [Syntrophales bacterium]MDD4338671.1 LPS assembly protein LptD [Syntrophales bacterium]HOG08417.1 LPS assembly protein LptD [Syntrophales bacterium]HOS76725.1 LPS assembly protein LptD [Syntrophales bacterium]HPB69682.1 LPS assembly protein LptD [Syntrophales bacterium]